MPSIRNVQLPKSDGLQVAGRYPSPYTLHPGPGIGEAGSVAGLASRGAPASWGAPASAEAGAPRATPASTALAVSGRGPVVGAALAVVEVAGGSPIARLDDP